MKSSSKFDIVVYGATGFTGQLVAEYLAAHYKNDASLKWAMAGRSLDKLKSVRDAIGAPADTPLIAADSGDPASLKAMIDQTRSVVTTVGPYLLYGNELVAACAASGTDYFDLCGEVPWMRQIIDAHQATAERSGARIMFSCGYDFSAVRTWRVLLSGSGEENVWCTGCAGQGTGSRHEGDLLRRHGGKRQGDI